MTPALTFCIDCAKAQNEELALLAEEFTNCKN